MKLEEAIRHKLMIAFHGMTPPAKLLDELRGTPLGGVTLFRSMNIQDPEQLRGLTAALQAASMQASGLPMLIGTDQEGGQLNALGQGTPFPGNLALGAIDDEDLTFRVGRALGLEMAAVGVNVNYAPVVDVDLDLDSKASGSRSFGGRPDLVARMGAAMVRGIQSAGVAATVKHFPGHGEARGDSHYVIPVYEHGIERLRAVQLPPFQAAFDAGAKALMTAHLAIPALNEGADTPATLSRPVLHDLLRVELGFQGVVFSDAMNMHAISQGPGLLIDALAALAAGVDLLLLVSDEGETQAIYSAVLQAARRKLLDAGEIFASAERVLELKRWLAQAQQPALDVVGCAEHQALALEAARRSITLVRDTTGMIPMRLSEKARLAVVTPKPVDLTPADTSMYVTPELASALRKRGMNADEFVVPVDLSLEDAAVLHETLAGYDQVVVGTINAGYFPGQAALVRSLLQSGTFTIPVAMRSPNDLSAFPETPVYLCTYSIQPPSMQALAEILCGESQPTGKLPVQLGAAS